MLLGWGCYVLADAFAHPVAAQAAGVITAAFFLALGLVLLFYLFKPRRIPRAGRPQSTVNSLTRATKPESHASSRKTEGNDLRGDLAYQRFYIDHSRIRP
jgi:hypothetical protein